MMDMQFTVMSTALSTCSLVTDIYLFFPLIPVRRIIRPEVPELFQFFRNIPPGMIAAHNFHKFIDLFLRLDLFEFGFCIVMTRFFIVVFYVQLSILNQHKK